MPGKSIPRSALSPEEVQRQRAIDRAKYQQRQASILARKRRWRDKNRAKINARQLERKHVNIEIMRADDAVRHKRYRAEDPEKHRAASRKSRAKHHEKRKAEQRVRHHANRETLLPQSRLRSQAHYQANKPAYHARSAKWRREHREALRALEARREARKANAPINDFTAAEWRALCKAVGYFCCYCGEKFAFKELTRDHLTPYAKQGSNTLHNILPACLSCNSRKHTKDVLCPVQPFLLLEI
jgi:5-methylcytosine-specific restriction endonuclease McrA